MPFNTQKGYCTRKEAAEILNVSIRTIDNYMTRGILKNYAPMVDEGRQEIRLRIADVEALKPHAGEIADIEQEIKEYKAKLKEERDELYEDYKSLSKLGIFKDAFYYDMPAILEAMLSICNPLQEREKNILADVLKGYTADELVNKYQLSRERIRQIVNKASRVVHDRCFPQVADKYRAVMQDNENLRNENEMIRKAYTENLARLAEYEDRYNILAQIDNPDYVVRGNLDTVRLLLSKLSDFGFSIRAYNIMKAADMETVAELVSYSRAELMKFRGFGRKSLAEVDAFVEKKSLSFGMDLTEYGFIRSDKGIWQPMPAVLNTLKNY